MKEWHTDESPRLRPVPLGDLLTTPTPAPPFVIHGLIPRREVTLLGGHGGAGKSIIGLTLCAHVAAGAHAWAGFTVEDGHALFVSLEDPGDVVRWRLRRIVEACRLDAEKIGRRLHILDGTGSDASLAGEVNDAGVRRLAFTAAMGEVADAAAGKRLIVIDGASDAFDADENSRRQVRAFVRELARITREADTGLILLAHIDKAAARFGSQGNSYSGSTAWHNSVRARLALVAGDGAVELVPEKLQHAKMAEPIPLAWTDAGVLIPTDRRAAQAGAEAARAEQATEDAEHVLAAIAAAENAGATVYTGRSGSHSALSSLRTFELPGEIIAGRSERFWRALDALLADGRIAAVEFKNSQRNTRMKYVPTAAVKRCTTPPITPCITAQQERCNAAVDCCSERSGTAAVQRASSTCARCNGEGCRHCGGSGRAAA